MRRRRRAFLLIIELHSNRQIIKLRASAQPSHSGWYLLVPSSLHTVKLRRVCSSRVPPVLCIVLNDRLKSFLVSTDPTLGSHSSKTVPSAQRSRWRVMLLHTQWPKRLHVRLAIELSDIPSVLLHSNRFSAVGYADHSTLAAAYS